MKRAIFAALVVACVPLACEEGRMIPQTGTLVIAPDAAEVMHGGLVQFSATGGTSPYTFSLHQNVSGGSVHPVTGLYQAGSLSPGQDKIMVSDAAGAGAESTVLVRAALSLTPASSMVLISDTVNFQAWGGNPPYTYSISINSSGAGIDPVTGSYVAGTTYNVTDTVRVSDSTGASATASAEVLLAFPLDVSPASTMVLAGTGRNFGISGGTPPYSVAFVQNQSGATASALGSAVQYTAGNNTNGTAGSLDVIEVLDSTVPQLIVQATIVVPGLQVSPSSFACATNASLQFVASGGLPPYSWSLTSGPSGGTVSATGMYRSGFYSGVDVVAMQDSNCTTVSVYVTVTAVIVSGQTNYNITHLDALDFDQAQVLIPYGFSNGNLGDVYFDYIISILPNAQNLPIMVVIGNAQGMIDAGTNTAIDPRSVSYTPTASQVTIGTYTGSTHFPIANKTVCVKTQEGFFVRMVFPSGQNGPCAYTIYR